MQKILLTVIVIFFSFNNSSSEKYKPVVVLELFTSQGCSSCPAADKLLKEIKNDYDNNQVISLSYHVDYWNYIGWKDPFSSKVFTSKQREYCNKFYSSTAYTPQIVINGKEHFVGSNRSIMNSKLKEYLRKSTENEVTISNIETINDAIKFNYEVEGSVSNKSLRIVLVINERITSVNRGENRNRKLINTNIVVAEDIIDLNKISGQGTIIIPSIVNAEDKLSLILIAQNDDLDITGAVQHSL